MKKILLPLLFFCFIAHSQNNIPTDYFSHPMNIDLILSGNFGELRSNHFHSGLDIKTQQREGIPIYASADGYVSRLNVQHFGYGKAAYIQHPNGYTTVYAHLQKFDGKIEDFVKRNQYQKESYEMELYPKSGDLPVKKGDLIGYSGNSGSSGGPHLHFEIRDGSQRPMNPLLFGFDIPDKRPPIINGLFVYPQDENAHVNQNGNVQKIRLIQLKDGNYKTEDFSAFGKIGFGISTDDLFDGASNKTGPYEISTTLNSSKNFEVRFDKFSFNETRYLNRYIDYGYFKDNNTRIQKLFRETNNPLSIIIHEKNNGFLEIKDGHDYTYSIEIKDFKGNKTTILVPIKGKEMEIISPKKIIPTEDFVQSSHAFSLRKGKFSIYIPAETLYEDVYLDIQAKGDTLKLHKDVVPVHKSISITADISDYKASDREKLFIGRLNYRGTPGYVSSTRKDDKLTASTRVFGDFAIVSDSIPPVVRPVNFSEGKWISDQSTLQIKITDNLSGISSYRATINGKFILMEYEPKKDLLVYDFNDNVNQETENNLRLVVIDNVGNSTTFEAKFFRKQL